MNLSGLLTMAIMCISWCPQVQGLNCYICDSTMDSCYSNVSSKYLKDCHPSADGCTSFSLENKDHFGPDSDKRGHRWFQRSCIYPTDYRPFGIHAGGAPRFRNEENVVFQDHHVYHLESANWHRRGQGIEELPIPNIFDEFFTDHDYVPFNRARFCGNVSDGCNNWEGEPPFPQAEGFPALEFKERKEALSCWACWIKEPDSWGSPGTKTCVDINNSNDDWIKERYMKSSKGLLGCSLHSIYQASPTGTKRYFERDIWYPGDQWCLQKRFPSTPPATEGRSLAKYKRSCEEGSVAEDTCSNGFYRALEGQDNKHLSYSWTGQRTFYSVKEFYDFILCKMGARYRAKIWDDVSFNFNEEIEKAAKEFVEGSGPFAFVGFHFCGPNKDFCNDWSDDKLYQFMDNPPTTTTTTVATTTTTTQPTIPTTTTKSTRKETTFGGVIIPEEEPDERCCVKKDSGGGKLSLGISTVLFPVAAALFGILQ